MMLKSPKLTHKRNIQLHTTSDSDSDSTRAQPHFHYLTRRSSSSIDTFFGSTTTATIVISILLFISSLILILSVVALLLFIRHRRQRAKQPALRDLLLGSISHPRGSFARRESSIWGGSTIWGENGNSRMSGWESGLESGGAIELKSATAFGGVNGYSPAYGRGVDSAKPLESANVHAKGHAKGNPSGEWVKFSDPSKTPMSGPYPTFPR